MRKIINIRDLVLFLCLNCGLLMLASKAYAQDNIDKKDLSEPIIITLPEDPEVTNIIEQYDALKSRQDYDIITKYILQITNQYKSAKNINSVILKPHYNGKDINIYQCGSQPLSMIIDLDSSTQSNNKPNLEFNEMINQARTDGVSIIWLSDQYDKKKKIISELQNNIFFKEGDHLSFVQKDNKQLHRQSLSQTYCIIAIIGDNKSDFDEVFDYLRNPDQHIALNKFFEKGWFLRDLSIISSSQ